MTSYQETLQAIFAHVDYSRSRQTPYTASTYNLERMRALCARMGNPQDQFPSLHIAGSKGKGSTAATVAAILQEAGCRTGLYTSPHLHSLRERMRIDGEMISRERLAELWLQARPVVKALERTTTFEIITLLAFLHFAQAAVDWAVLEVGLGGRLDATNVIHPEACAITSLSHDHTDLLGHTLSLIAFEKAGIIKPGAPVVVGPQAPEAMAVIEDVAEETNAQIWRVDEKEGDWRWRVRKANRNGLQLDIFGPDVYYPDIWTPLAGYHQAANATVAVALIHLLRERGAPITEDIIRAGAARAYWPGRLETLAERPLFVVDSAHNRHSAERLAEALDLFSHQRMVLLFGASADKDIRGMLEVLAPRAAAIVVTQSFHPRAASPERLADLARRIVPDTPIHISPDVIPALDLAISLVEEKDMILGTGSIFVVAALREAWNARHPEAFPPDDWVHFAEPIDVGLTPMLYSPEKATVNDIEKN
ncbi:MAG: bifunctional folylpolyglutamate synthase/dihydrofolate synthase [Chloroflexi bacterium]|nr:bifunctional folylpolyglutamate synthase/dihydrofolate synthase [Chloroflexota bacterium]